MTKVEAESGAAAHTDLRFHGIGTQRAARAVVYTFGAAGTGAATWIPFREQLTGVAEVRAARLPGRENRWREKPLDSVGAQVDDLGTALEELIELDDRPYFLVGLCWGTVTAYEIARRLEEHSTWPPFALVVGNDTAPMDLITQVESVHEYEHDRFRAWCLDNLRLPAELADQRAFRFFEPMLRADIAVASTFQRTGHPLRRCPVVAVSSAPEITRTWRSLAERGFHELLVETPVTVETLGPVVAELIARGYPQ